MTTRSREDVARLITMLRGGGPSDTADALEALAAHCGRLERALHAACVMAHGRACFRTDGNIAMQIPKERERIVRTALAADAPEVQ